MFLDEFHYAKQGGKTLKFIVDTHPVKIFISGSSAAELSIQAVKYLVGRIFLFNLFQLNFNEFLNFKKNLSQKIKLEQAFEEYAVYGGYPRVVLSETKEEKQLVLKNIYNTYFLREVKDILGLADDYKLTQMIKGLALQIGNLVEWNEIGNISELSFETIKTYANFLEKTYTCHFVKPFFKNKRTEIVKNPKIYFYDTGLRNYVVDDFRTLDKRNDGGFLLENVFSLELIKHEIKFNFWRSKKQAEVDFVVSFKEGRKEAFEIKRKVYKNDQNSFSIISFKNQYPEIPVKIMDKTTLPDYFLKLPKL